MALHLPADEVIQMLKTEDIANSALNAGADTARRGAQWDEALRLCQESIASCTETDFEDEYCRAVAHVYLGAVYHSMGADDDAEQCYRVSSDHFGIIAYRYSDWNAAAADYGLGLIAQNRPDFESARASFSRSLKLLKRVSERKDLTDVEQKDLTRHVGRIQQQLAHANLQVAGRIKAGLPGGAEEMPADAILVGQTLHLEDGDYRIKPLQDSVRTGYFRPKLGDRYVVLKVEGTSMIGAGIAEGDYVVVRGQARVESGEIAAVLKDDPAGTESTVKKFYRQGNKVVLKAANSAFIPQEQHFRATDPTIRILGKVVAVACPMPD